MRIDFTRPSRDTSEWGMSALDMALRECNGYCAAWKMREFFKCVSIECQRLFWYLKSFWVAPSIENFRKFLTLKNTLGKLFLNKIKDTQINDEN